MDIHAENLPLTETKEKVGNNYKPLLTIITILLAILILLNGYQVFSTNQQNMVKEQRAMNYEERVKQAIDSADAQKVILINVLESYQDDAYGINVDRIAEQQLIATEYTIQLLQSVAILNTEIITLLATMP